MDGNNLVGGGLGHFVVLCRKGEDVAAAAHGDGKGLGSCAVHADEELHGVIFIYIIKVLIAGILINGDAECQLLCVRVIAGGEAGDGVLQQGRGDADAGKSGDVHIFIGLVAEEVGDAGLAGDGNGQPGAVKFLDLVEEADELAAGAGMEVTEVVLGAVDGDLGIAGLDVLVGVNIDGDQVATLVGARRGGDGEGGLVFLRLQRIAGTLGGCGITVHIVGIFLVYVWIIAYLLPCNISSLAYRHIQELEQRICFFS